MQKLLGHYALSCLAFSILAGAMLFLAVASGLMHKPLGTVVCLLLAGTFAYAAKYCANEIPTKSECADMKKPMHGFACVLWATAALYPVSEIFRLMTFPPAGNNPLPYWLAGRSAVIVALELAAFAILVEIADKIRWHGMTPEEQSRLSEPSALDRRLSR